MRWTFSNHQNKRSIQMRINVQMLGDIEPPPCSKRLDRLTEGEYAKNAGGPDWLSV